MRTQNMGSDHERRLSELNARFIHNFVRNDVVSHDRITHQDFVCVTSKGAREGKKAYLARWATGFDPNVITYWDYRDERIGVFGSMALVWAVNKHITVRDGKETMGMTAYTDAYILQNDEWKCVQAQLTPVSIENYPPDHTIVRKYIKGKLQE